MLSSFIAFMILLTVNGEYFQLSNIDIDGCVGQEIVSTRSTTECVLVCSRENQIAVYKKENKQCFCTNEGCLQINKPLRIEVNDTKAIVFQKIKGYPGFVMDFQKPTVNVPTLPSKLFEITEEFSFTSWVYLYDKYLPKTAARLLFTIPINEAIQPSIIQAYTHQNTGPYVIYKGVSCRTLDILPSAKWVHLSATVLQTKDFIRFKSYINDNLVKQELIAITSINELQPGESYKGIVLGNDVDQDAINDPDQFINGRITDLYIYNAILSDKQVYEIYKNLLLPINPILSWDEFRGTADENDVKTIEYPETFD